MLCGDGGDGGNDETWFEVEDNEDDEGDDGMGKCAMASRVEEKNKTTTLVHKYRTYITTATMQRATKETDTFRDATRVQQQ